MGAESKVFTHSQVSSHSTCEDCWVIINGKVYNVTSYLNDHPGGDDVLLGQAGKDASQEFEDVGHSSTARLMLDEFYVGEVDPTIGHPINATLAPTRDIKDKSSESNNKFIYFILALAIIGLGVGIHLYNFST